ncbi:MAG: FAD-binding oxidoreductase [Verrucomicrobia bacterium]|nr:FAD-binding oxidoreductase [Verrucomicrobiota bacterium]MDA1087138.1 FAD-binding oxidoreductase [Verrucomicrobiota bacterium]
MDSASTLEHLDFQVQEVRDLNKATYVLRVDRHSLKFKAGQCVSVGVRGTGINREYSTYSGEQDPYVELLIREVKDGLVSSALRRCKPGESLSFMGAYGSFVLEKPEDSARKYLFIGTGTGIAPFHSFVRSFPDIDYTILHGVRYLNERYDFEDYASGRYISCVTKEDGGDFRGRVTDYLRQTSVAPNQICYLCGNRLMLAEAFDLLREQGVPGDNLFTEVFF